MPAAATAADFKRVCHVSDGPLCSVRVYTWPCCLSVFFCYFVGMCFYCVDLVCCGVGVGGALCLIMSVLHMV